MPANKKITKIIAEPSTVHERKMLDLDGDCLLILIFLGEHLLVCVQEFSESG